MQEFQNEHGWLVSIRSIQDSLFGFLSHVGLFTILVRLKLLQKFLTDMSFILALKSPKNRRCLYLEVHKSVLLLNAVMCDPLTLCGGYKINSKAIFSCSLD